MSDPTPEVNIKTIGNAIYGSALIAVGTIASRTITSKLFKKDYGIKLEVWPLVQLTTDVAISSTIVTYAYKMGLPDKPFK